jgi:hypothetical protein
MSKNKYHSVRQEHAAGQVSPDGATGPGEATAQAENADSPAPGSEPVVYGALPVYWIMAGGALVATVFLIVDMFSGLRWDTLFFSAIGLVGGLWALWMASTRLIVLDEGLLVQRATAQYLVDYRQLLRVQPSGRLLAVMALIYHPRRDDGIIDTDAVGSLLVPGVRRQSELLQTLEQRIPA